MHKVAFSCWPGELVFGLELGARGCNWKIISEYVCAMLFYSRNGMSLEAFYEEVVCFGVY